MANQMSPLGGMRTDRVRPQASPEGDSTSRLLFDRLAVVFRYRHLVVVAVLLAIVGALLKAYTTLPLYRANATVLLEETLVSADVFRSAPRRYYQDREPFLETQYRVLQSRDLALRVVERLDVAEAPEFNGEGPEPPVLQAAFVSFQRAVIAALRRIVGGSAGTEPQAPAAPPSPNALATAILSRVRVTPVPNSHLVNVAFESADPKLAARAVNTLAEEYVRLNLELRLVSTEETLAWLAEELARQKAKVEAAEHGLATYRETQNALSLDGSQDIVTTRLQHLNDALTVAERTRVQKEALYAQIQAMGVNSATDFCASSSARNACSSASAASNSLRSERMASVVASPNSRVAAAMPTSSLRISGCLAPYRWESHARSASSTIRRVLTSQTAGSCMTAGSARAVALFTPMAWTWA